MHIDEYGVKSSSNVHRAVRRCADPRRQCTGARRAARRIVDMVVWRCGCWGSGPIKSGHWSSLQQWQRLCRRRRFVNSIDLTPTACGHDNNAPSPYSHHMPCYTCCIYIDLSSGHRVPLYWRPIIIGSISNILSSRPEPNFRSPLMQYLAKLGELYLWVP